MTAEELAEIVLEEWPLDTGAAMYEAFRSQMISDSTDLALSEWGNVRIHLLNDSYGWGKHGTLFRQTYRNRLARGS